MANYKQTVNYVPTTLLDAIVKWYIIEPMKLRRIEGSFFLQLDGQNKCNEIEYILMQEKAQV